MACDKTKIRVARCKNYLFVHEEVGNKVLRLAGDVGPELVVEVDVAHLDTLQGLAVVLKAQGI